MPYNPSVNDRSGEILAGYQTRSSEITAAGNQALAQGITDGVTSIAGGVIGGFTKAAENKMTSEYLDQMAGQFANTPGMDGKTMLMSQEELDKFSKMSLSAKQGMIVPKQAMFDQSLKNQYLAAQIEGFGQRQAIQNQVPANQVPMSPSANPAPATNQAPAPAAPYIFNPNIKTRSSY
jgi:hypothetical protein